MRRWTLFICSAAFALVATISGRAAHAQVERQINHLQMPPDWTEDYQSAPRPDERQYLLEEQFTYATDEDLETWTASANEDVALRAAWELARQVKCDVVVDGQRRFDQAAVARFLGFLEGRLRVKPPSWWEELIQDAEKSGDRWRDSFIRTVGVELRVPVQPAGLEGGPVLGTEYEWFGGTSLRFSGKDLIVSGGSRELTINNGLTHIVALGDRNSMSAVTVGERVVLANFEVGNAAQYRMVCIDAPTGKALWNSDVWSLGHAGFIWGLALNSHWIEIVARDRRVAIFGADPDGIYAEVFDIETGACLGRFCTGYVYTESCRGLP